jgi:hypothetical protein
VQKNKWSKETNGKDTQETNIPEITDTPPKRKSTMQMGEQRKKMKAQKNPIQLTITEDDTELVADKVQDRGEDTLYVTESQREEIMKKLMEGKEFWKEIKLNVAQKKRTIGSLSATEANI